VFKKKHGIEILEIFTRPAEESVDSFALLDGPGRGGEVHYTRICECEATRVGRSRSEWTNTADADAQLFLTRV
jgi:hypothetical protein